MQLFHVFFSRSPLVNEIIIGSKTMSVNCEPEGEQLRFFLWILPRTATWYSRAAERVVGLLCGSNSSQGSVSFHKTRTFRIKLHALYQRCHFFQACASTDEANRCGGRLRCGYLSDLQPLGRICWSALASSQVGGKQESRKSSERTHAARRE